MMEWITILICPLQILDVWLIMKTWSPHKKSVFILSPHKSHLNTKCLKFMRRSDLERNIAEKSRTTDNQPTHLAPLRVMNCRLRRIRDSGGGKWSSVWQSSCSSLASSLLLFRCWLLQMVCQVGVLQALKEAVHLIVKYWLTLPKCLTISSKSNLHNKYLL